MQSNLAALDFSIQFHFLEEFENLPRICIAITSASEQVNTFPEPDNALQGRRTYLLSANQIRSLKHCISLHSKGADGDTAPAAAAATPPSTYAAVASLVWTSGVRAKNALDDAAADTYLMFAANYRARLRPPLPAAFFGNCAKSCYARATVGGLRDARGGERAAAAEPVRGVLQEGGADGVRVPVREDLLWEAPLRGGARLRLRLQGRRPRHHRPCQPPDQGREAALQNLIDRRG